MSQDNTLACPVDFVSINEYKVRLIALQVFACAVFTLVQPHWIVISLLVVDFLLRTFNAIKFSPFAAVATGITRVFTIGFKPVDQGPKRFAAGIGLTFSIAMLATYLLGYTTTTLVLTATLTLFSFLEAFLSFCAGCYVYTFLTRIFKTSRSWNR